MKSTGRCCALESIDRVKIKRSISKMDLGVLKLHTEI